MIPTKPPRRAQPIERESDRCDRATRAQIAILKRDEKIEALAAEVAQLRRLVIRLGRAVVWLGGAETQRETADLRKGEILH